MTGPRDSAGEGSSSILRAVGSLLVALSGGDDSAARRLLGNMQQQEVDPRGGEYRPPVQDPAQSQAQPQPGPRSQYREPDYRPESRTEYRPEYREPYAPPAATYGAAPSPSYGSGADNEVEFILADARARAQRILDESMERARELVRRERAAAPPAFEAIDRSDFDDLRRSIHGLVTEVRDIQQRLSRIENLLRTQQVAQPSVQPSPASPTSMASTEFRPPTTAYDPPPAYQRPAPPPAYDPPREEPPPFEAPRAEEPRYEEPFHEEPEYGARYEEPEAVEPPSLISEGAPSPAPAPPRGTFSVVPPERRDWDEPAATAHEDESPPSLPPSPLPGAFSGSAAPVPQTWPEPEPMPGADIATFLPADGAIVLRVTPVAGFQGLMRVQDALARLPAVRTAAVEAYSQGEARLRIELLDATDSEELAAGLAQSLKEPAYVREASESARQLLIALR